QVPDLARSHTDVASRHIGLLIYIAVQLRHEALAEPHDFFIALTVRIEIASTLAATDALARERVLEDLFKAEKLDDRKIHAGVKPQTALERPESRVELHPKPSIDSHPVLIVKPGNTKEYLPFGFNQPFEHASFNEFWVLGKHR